MLTLEELDAFVSSEKKPLKKLTALALMEISALKFLAKGQDQELFNKRLTAFRRVV